MHVLIRQLFNVIEGLQQWIVDLENRLNQNSLIRIAPPSEDGGQCLLFSRKPEKGKIGGKDNHTGDTLKKMDYFA
ncbi:MAG: hypothetical protein NW218_19470 [Saprospiraceae bacterium]|nr:hypothetical protein [Saprospiraceae bacterium]